jgi:Domain of unknown function (DUF2017)
VIGTRRFRRDRSGRYRLSLSEPERTLLRTLPEQAKDLVSESEPTAKRLFPPAYPTDDAAEADYRASAGASLLDRHRRSLDAVMASVDASSLDEAQAHEWLDALEVLRLVVGTHLDVTEEPMEVDEDDPLLPHAVVYQYLSALQDDVVAALSETVPEEGTGAEPPELSALDLGGLDLHAPDGLDDWFGS